jgi:hypothetical protein
MPVAAGHIAGHEAGKEEREREAGAEDEFVTREDEFATPDKRKAPETLRDAADEAAVLTVPPTFAGAAAVATAAV